MNDIECPEVKGICYKSVSIYFRVRLNFASPRKRKPESEIAYGASGTDHFFRIRPLRIGSEPESGLRFRIFTFGKGALPRKLASLSDR